MLTPDKTIDHGTLRRLVEAGAHVGAEHHAAFTAPCLAPASRAWWSHLPAARR